MCVSQIKKALVRYLVMMSDEEAEKAAEKHLNNFLCQLKETKEGEVCKYLAYADDFGPGLEDSGEFIYLMAYRDDTTNEVKYVLYYEFKTSGKLIQSLYLDTVTERFTSGPNNSPGIYHLRHNDTCEERRYIDPRTNVETRRYTSVATGNILFELSINQITRKVLYCKAYTDNGKSYAVPVKLIKRDMSEKQREQILPRAGFPTEGWTLKGYEVKIFYLA